MTTISKIRSDKSKNAKNPFSADEDRKLISLVKFFARKKDINWTYISLQMKTRSPRQCKDRWCNYLDTKINKTEFSAEENAFILQKVGEMGKKWKKIASMMNNRTDVSIKSQYRKLMRRNANLNNVYYLCMDSYSTRRKKLTNNTLDLQIEPDESTQLPQMDNPFLDLEQTFLDASIDFEFDL